MGRRIGRQFIVVCRAGQRIAHDFDAPLSHQQIRSGIDNTVRRLLVAVGDNVFDMVRVGHVVEAVDAQDFFRNVGFALHIDPVGRNSNIEQCISILSHALAANFDFQPRQDGLGRGCGNIGPNQPIDASQINGEFERSNLFGIDIDHFRGDGSPGQFFHQQGRPPQGIGRHVGVGSAFEAERGVGAQAVAACAFAHRHGVEVGCFDKDIRRGVRHPAVEPAEDTGQTHRPFSIANHQVFGREFVFHTIQRGERFPFLRPFDDDLVSGHFRHVEGMKRFAAFEHHEISDVHHIVLGVQADGVQPFLEPLGAGADFHPFDRHAHIARSTRRVFHPHCHGQRFRVIDPESRYIGQRSCRRCSVGGQVGSQVTGYPVVRSGIDTVRGQTHFEHVFILHMKYLRSRRPHFGCRVEYDNSVVGCPNANLIFCTEHPERLHAPNFGLFDFESLLFARRVEGGSDLSQDDLLSGGHIRRAAHHLQRFRPFACRYGGHVEVVRVGMVRAGQHFGHHQPLQTSADGFDLFNPFDFESCCRQNGRSLFGREVGFDIIFQPVVSDFHLGSLLVS